MGLVTTLFDIAFIALLCMKGVHSGALLSKCAPINTHLELDCGDVSIIYIRQTIISDYHSMLSPSDICFLPPLNRFCHAYTNSTDIQYNGKHRSHYLFTSGRLTYYGATYGECRSDSTSKVVQIQYECLSSIQRPSVCSNVDNIGDKEGFLMSPNFPNPVEKAYEKCDCQLTATNMGIIKLTAILINPIYKEKEEEGWDLSLEVAGGEVVPLDTMHRYTSEIEIPYVSSLEVRYRSYSNSDFLPTLIPTLPPGFWIKYYVEPQNARINVRCKQNEQDTEIISMGMVAVISGTSAVFILFVAAIVYCGCKRKCNNNSKARGQHASGVINAGAEIEYLPNPNQAYTKNGLTRSDLDISCLGYDENFFHRRCGTLPDLQVSRYNSLPPNFTARGKLKKYSMSDCCSVDSGFEIATGCGPDPQFNTLPSKNSHRRQQNTRNEQSAAANFDATYMSTPIRPDFNCAESEGSTHDEDSLSYGSYAMSCTTLGMYGYESFQTLEGTTNDEVDV